MRNMFIAIKALQKYGISHGRLVILIEACEESGSPDLPFYVEKLADRIGEPNLIVCLDSGCGNYEQLWVTSSLRGVIGGNLTCKIVTEGVHSGDSSGVVPGSFRLIRSLISRLEDEETGKIKGDAFNTELSEARMEKVKQAAKILGKKGIAGRFPLVPGASVMADDPIELALNRWWRPQLVIVGQQGLPDASAAGNVMRPSTKLTLSLRLPPTIDAKAANQALKETLLKDPPYNCEVSFEGEKTASGWAAPETAPWLESALQKASNTVFNKPAVFQGEGGSIPFMGMLGKLFPKAQFCVIGLLGPESNAHGPNEFLHIDYSAKLSICVALVVNDHCKAKVETLISSATNGKVADAAQLAAEYTRKEDGTKM